MRKPYKPLIQRLNESRNRYQQLTGTSNKTILRENKTLLTEAEICGEDTGYMDGLCDCGCRGTTTRVTYCDGGYTDTDDCGCCAEGKFIDNDKPMAHKGKSMNEQTNPFSGGGSGPNWQAAEAAWANFQQSTQSSPPGPDATFLSNMAGKGCGFYEKRLTAQINSFVNQFGGSFGGAGSSNPAWQSQKYARIMWLANQVQQCSGANTSGTVQCFYDWINDSSNDGPLTSAQCANGNAAVNASNIQQTKFRHQSIADCPSLQNKIDDMAALMTTSTGCNLIRKTAKHDWLSNLKNNCC